MRFIKVVQQIGCICARSYSNAIPEEIIIEGTKELGPILAAVASDLFLLNEAIENLRAYSPLVRDPQARTLNVRHLVQAVCARACAPSSNNTGCRVSHAVAAAYPESPDFINWSTLERLLPHALTCAVWIERALLARHHCTPAQSSRILPA